MSEISSSSSSFSRSPIDFKPPTEPITVNSPTVHVKRFNHRSVPDTVIPKIFYPGEEYALDGIAIRSNLLGFAAASCLYISLYLWSIHSFWQLSLFVGILAVFHFLEFYITARYNTSKAVIDSFLLSSNGVAYNTAHTAAVVEAVIEWWIWPSLKHHTTMISLGLFLIFLGQTVRALAMAHAATNFNHHVATMHREGHILVKTGIYQFSRHPSYFGFFYWGLGTQLLLGNPICFVGYAIVLWRFFQLRIKSMCKLHLSVIIPIFTGGRIFNFVLW